jgi:hypothetical protein
MRRGIPALVSGAVLALATRVPSAHADIDYRALAEEHRTLKDDPEVVAALAVDLKTAHHFEKLEKLLQDSLGMVRDAKQQAEQARRDRAAALILMLSGGAKAGPEVGRALAQGDRQAYELELAASQALDTARDALVELVSGYREIKAAMLEAKTAAAEKATKAVQQPKTRSKRQ